MNWKECETVESDPHKMSGAWVFAGTRIPVSTLFLNLRDGASIDDFMEWFPGVSRNQVESVLEFIADQSTEAAA